MTNLKANAFLSIILPVLFIQMLAAEEVYKPEETLLTVSTKSKTSYSPFNYVEMISESNNQLGIRFYHELKDGQANFVFSPFGVFVALESLLDGARGKANEEVSAMLGIPSDRSNWRSSVFIMYKSLIYGNLGNPFEIFLPNSVWLQQGENPTALFKVATVAKGDFHQVDFQNDWETLPKEINAWIAEASGGQFTKLIRRRDIGNSTKLLICNTFNFKSWWNNYFDTDKTQERPFTLDSGKVVRVDTMEIVARLRGSWQKNLSLVELPYNGAVGSERLAFILLLPDKLQGIEALEKQINTTNLRKWMKNLITQKIMIRMPKFSINTRIPLKKKLRKMGVEAVFSNQADFSGINGKKSLKLDEIYHATSLICNEWGSKIVLQKQEEGEGFRGIMSSTIPRNFIVDHPFVFLVYDRFSNSILMIGRVTNPSL